ncbi:MAG: PD-(D/E)XK nuclease-like domain-containing protein [Candidatus Binatia bacterium]|nr:PD-(D/E)XK nuclease-like domain-containing protein [Candidatus Binatia bacterium]
MTITIENNPDITDGLPGLYPDVPEEAYHSIPACNQSRLKLLGEKSEAHVYHEMQNPTPPTPEMEFGSAVHVAVLQPDQLERRYVVVGQCAGQTQKGERCANGGSIIIDGHSFCRRHVPKTGTPDDRRTIRQVDFDRCRDMRDSVYACASARDALEHPDPTELSALWSWNVDGFPLPCKARMDKLLPSAGAIADLKTTVDASPRGFVRAVYTYGYYVQAAFYTQGAAALGCACDDFLIVAVEKEPPFACAIYRVRDDAIEAGFNELQPLLLRYAHAVQTNTWPSYPQTPIEIGLPDYAWKQITERIEA